MMQEPKPQETVGAQGPSMTDLEAEIHRVRNAAKENPAKFIVLLAIDDGYFRQEMIAMNLESLVAELTVATAVNMPRIKTWHIFDAAGKLLVWADPMARVVQIAETTPIKTVPGDKKAAGWRAVPALSPTTDDWQKMVDATKKEGRQIR